MSEDQQKVISTSAGQAPGVPSTSAVAHRVTVAEVGQIAALSDPVLRNLRITLAYHDLAVGMGELLGRANASWCCFGTWASRTAGRFIRGEATPRIIRTVLAFVERVPEQFRVLTPAALAQEVTQVTNNVAQGNLIVFQDLGMLYARMLQAHAEETDHGRAAQRCRAALRPGPVEEGGEDLLIGAVDAYHDAMLAANAAQRAELVFLANLRIGLHEQIRLQKPIMQALTSPPVYRFTPMPLRRRLDAAWRDLATGHLMDIRLPGLDFEHTGELTRQSLGADVRRAQNGDVFPPDLTRLHNLELKALLYDLDRHPNTLLGSAAHDWSDLADRMNFVADLFRVWQQDSRLYLPPFTPEQIDNTRAGRIPASGPPL